jgi:AsmA protein
MNLIVSCKLLSLLFGDDIEIKSAAFHDLRLNLDVLPNGMANYTSILRQQKTVSEDTASSINLSLDNLRIVNGIIHYNDLTSDMHIMMNGFDYEGKGDFKQNIFDLASKATVDEFSLIYKNVRYLYEKHVTASMITEMNLRENRFTLKDNALQINHFKFSVEGNLDLLNHAYAMDLKFKTKETSFQNIISLLPGIYMKDMEQIKTQGEIAFHGYVKGIYSEKSIPAFSVNLDIRDASFKIDSLPAAVERIACTLSFRNDYAIADSTVMDISNFHLDMLGYPAHGRILIKNFSHPFIDADIFADLDVSVLEKMYPIQGIDMKGTLRAEVKARGQYKWVAAGNASDSMIIQQLPAFHVDLQVNNGLFKYDHLPAPVDNIQFHLVADNKDGKLENSLFDLRTFHIDLDGEAMHGRIKMEGYETMMIDADIKSKVDLAKLEKMYPITDATMKGLVDMDITAKGIYNAKLKKFPLVDAHINLSDGFLQLTNTPEPLTNVHLVTEAINNTGKFANTRFEIQQLTYTMEGEPFEVKGSISNLDNITYDLQINGRVDLEKITQIYPIKGWTLKGSLYTNFETQGTLHDLESGHYERLRSTGMLKVKSFECRGPQIAQPIRIDNAEFVFTPEKIVLNQLQGKFGKSNVTITGDLTDYMAFVTNKNDLITGDLNLTCDTLDLNEWYTPVQADTASMQASRLTSLSQTAWAVPMNLNFKFDSDIGQVNYQDMKITQLKGEINIEDGVLKLHETGFNSLNASFNLNGEYQTKNIQHPLFDFELDIQELDINKAYREVQLIRTLAPAAANTFGELSIDYKLKGELLPDMTPKMETLVGGGEIRIAHAKINGMKIFEEISKTTKKQEMNDPHLRDFVMKTEIRDNKIFVKPFSIKLSGLNTDIEGVSELSGAINYIVHIELLPIEKLKIPFHVTGTYDKPKVTIGKGHSLPSSE